MSIKVSIIVPVYKVEKYIRNCIDSVIAQTYSDWELILVDDGSPDQCGAICDEYALGDSRIIVIHKENGGLSSARNAALDLPPNGEFVTFLDSDDFWHPDYLATMVKLCKENHADIAQCSFVRGSETVFPECGPAKAGVKVYDNHSVFSSEAAKIIMCAKLYRTSLWKDIRMPIGLYNEDDWTTWKLYYKAKRIVVTNGVLYYYTINPTSTMGNLKKKPDLRYFAAYDERINFFINNNNKDLEHFSRIHFCKSLILSYRNQKLSLDERKMIKRKFDENWTILKHSPYIGKKYQLLFGVFNSMPMTLSCIVAKLR